MMSRDDLDEEVSVTLRRRDWMVVVGAAESYERRVPREQGDGAACLDAIRAQANLNREEYR